MVKLRRVLLAVFTVVALGEMADAADKSIVVASTTSTEQSGLFGYLLPLFERTSGIAVRVIAQGTGQALDTGRRGDADVLFVHDKPGELKFVAEGWGRERREVMYNDFVIVGPEADPAHIAGGRDAVSAFTRIAAAKQPFASRGDDSGTNRVELRLWQAAGIDPRAANAGWYRELGSGMGPTLNTASALGAYALADRGTWISFRNRGELRILVQGDERLFNQYGVMLVNPAKHLTVKAELGIVFIEWLTSTEGQTAIAGYRIDGQQLFFPNFRRPGS
jgi:tungstate transport system substrate-binding protein